jgi:hypothetical protein
MSKKNEEEIKDYLTLDLYESKGDDSTDELDEEDEEGDQDSDDETFEDDEEDEEDKKANKDELKAYYSNLL